MALTPPLFGHVTYYIMMDISITQRRHHWRLCHTYKYCNPRRGRMRGRIAKPLMVVILPICMIRLHMNRSRPLFRIVDSVMGTGGLARTIVLMRDPG